MPELEFPPFDEQAIAGLSGARVCRDDAGQGGAGDASARGILQSIWRRNNWHGWMNWFRRRVPGRTGASSNCFTPSEAVSKGGEPNPPELQVKLHECFALKEHPRVCEGKLPVRLWLCAPDGKRIESTVNWPAFRTNNYPKLKPALQKKYPGTIGYTAAVGDPLFISESGSRRPRRRTFPFAREIRR